MFRQTRLQLTALFAAAISIAGLTACETRNPAEDPAIKPQLEKIGALEEKVDHLKSSHDSLGVDVNMVIDEVNALKRAQPADGASAGQLAAKVAALEKLSRDQYTEIESLKKEMASLKGGETSTQGDPLQDCGRRCSIRPSWESRARH